MELAEIPRNFPQFGKSVRSLIRSRSKMFGESHRRHGTQSKCGCGGMCAGNCGCSIERHEHSVARGRPAILLDGPVGMASLTGCCTCSNVDDESNGTQEISSTSHAFSAAIWSQQECEASPGCSWDYTRCGDRRVMPTEQCCCAKDLKVAEGWSPATPPAEQARRTVNPWRQKPLHWTVAFEMQGGSGGSCTWEYKEILLAKTGDPLKDYYSWLSGPSGFEHWNSSGWNSAESETKGGKARQAQFAAAQAGNTGEWGADDNPGFGPGAWGTHLSFLRIRSGCAQCPTCCALILGVHEIGRPTFNIKGPTCGAICDKEPVLAYEIDGVRDIDKVGRPSPYLTFSGWSGK